jgi:hypothetical protein
MRTQHLFLISFVRPILNLARSVPMFSDTACANISSSAAVQFGFLRTVTDVSQKFVSIILTFSLTICLRRFLSPFHKDYLTTNLNRKLNPTTKFILHAGLLLSAKVVSFPIHMRRTNISLLSAKILLLKWKHQWQCEENQIGLRRNWRWWHKLQQMPYFFCS